jgi:hypothetical protein
MRLILFNSSSLTKNSVRARQAKVVGVTCRCCKRLQLQAMRSIAGEKQGRQETQIVALISGSPRSCVLLATLAVAGTRDDTSF